MSQKTPVSILLLLLISIPLVAGVKSVGVAFVQNYPKELYQAGTQVWSIDQDEHGIMYFGNNNGLLTFDSKGWRTYPVPNQSIVRSVFVAGNDKVYIGAFNEFGYFQPDEKGELKYHSLMDKIPAAQREFGEVWQIMEYKQGIIFHSYDAVFYLKNNELNIISYHRDLHFAFKVNGDYYAKENGVGLLKLESDGLKIVPHSEFFADMLISGILLFDDDLVICTREHGIFILNDQGLSNFNTPLQNFFKQHQIFSAKKTDDDFLLLGTVQNGLIVLNRNGKLVQHLNRDRGLQNNTVLSLFIDKSKNLWMGLDNGIDYVLISSPLTHLAHESEIGTAYSSIHYNQNLYFGTNQGLYVSPWPPVPNLATQGENIQIIEGSQGQVWHLRNMKNQIVMGHDKGTFTVEGEKLRQINTTQGGWTFVPVPDHPNIMIEGTYSGLLSYEYDEKAKQWNFRKSIAGFTESCRQLYFDQKGYLWMGHGYKGIFKLKLNEELDSVVHVQAYTEDHGLPTHYQLDLLKFKDELIVSADEGIYTYNPKTDKFIWNTAYSDLFNNQAVNTLIEDNSGNLWFFGARDIGILKSNFDGSYTKTTKPFRPIQEKVNTSFEHVYPINPSNILFSTEEGIIHFDSEFRKDYHEPFRVAIRKVEILPDSVIFGGYSIENFGNPEENTLRYKDNRVRFSYSALSYEFTEHNEYSILLEGFADKWSDWSVSTEKEYTNLHQGTYSFKVRARNIYGNVSEAEPFGFEVLPPWYQSMLAYIIYVVLFIILILFIVRTVIRRFERQHHTLKEKQRADILAREKAFAEEALKSEQEIIKLRNEKLEAENLKSRAEIESKSKELASIAMQITYKNELLSQIKQKLIRVSSKMLHLESKKQVNDLIKTLEKDIINEDEWERFEVHFDQVHEDFLQKLRSNYHELTPKDLRLCAYLRMNLSSKEIAPLLNISVRGVEISRYRLRKKMGLPRDTNLTDFMMKV